MSAFAWRHSLALNAPLRNIPILLIAQPGHATRMLVDDLVNAYQLGAKLAEEALSQLPHIRKLIGPAAHACGVNEGTRTCTIVTALRLLQHLAPDTPRADVASLAAAREALPPRDR